VFRVTLVQLSTGQTQPVVFTNVAIGVYKFEYTLMIAGDYKFDISV